MQFITQGAGFGKSTTATRAVMVKIEKNDFFNRATGKIVPNPVAHPDAFVPDSLESSGGALGDHNQTGYIGALASLSLLPQMQACGMAWVSSVYIDNSQGMGTCILRHRSTGLQVTAAPSTQGHYPMLLPEGSDFSFDVVYIDPYGNNISTTPSFAIYPTNGSSYYNLAVETGYLRMQFTDVIVPPSVWSTRNMSTGIWYDYSESEAGGEFNKYLNPNPFRKGLLCVNANDDVTLALHLRQPGSFNNDIKCIFIGPGEHFMQLTPVHIGEVWVMIIGVGGDIGLHELV